MESELIELSRSVKRFDDHPLQRVVYSQDLLKIPKALSRFVKQPLCVVQPESDREVLEILKFSRKKGIPLVPRGAATSAYGGAVTIKPCIVVDFKRMNRVKVEDSKAIAEAGSVWVEVEREVNKKNLALRVYPSSAPSSTVGGWIAQGGYGIGSLKYGGIGENIEWLEIADFGGIKVVEGEKLKKYVGLFGTTGLILRACIKLREKREVSSVAVRTSFEKSLEMLDNAYHAAYVNGELCRLLGLNGEDVLLLSYEGDCEKEGDRFLGNRMWENRFNLFRAAKEKETIFSEAILPYETAADFFSRVEFPTEVVFAKDCAVFLGLIPVENYYTSAIKAVRFVKLAEKFGGRVYATGMLFPHKGASELREFKKAVDPNSLLNPGKAVEGNVFSKLLRLVEMIP